jgi:hypothetical protein
MSPLIAAAAVFLAMPAMAEPTPTAAQIGAGNFVQSLIEGGSSIKKHVTKDAMVIAGDIGSPLSELIREKPSFAKAFAGCRVEESKELTSRVPDEGFGNPEWAKGRMLTQVDVKLNCKTASSDHLVLMQIFVDGDRVALFMIGDDRTDG